MKGKSLITLKKSLTRVSPMERSYRGTQYPTKRRSYRMREIETRPRDSNFSKGLGSLGNEKPRRSAVT